MGGWDPENKYAFCYRTQFLASFLASLPYPTSVRPQKVSSFTWTGFVGDLLHLSSYQTAFMGSLLVVVGLGGEKERDPPKDVLFGWPEKVKNQSHKSDPDPPHKETCNKHRIGNNSGYPPNVFQETKPSKILWGPRRGAGSATGSTAIRVANRMFFTP